MHLPRPLRTLRNATLRDGTRADVVLDGDVVAAVCESGTAAPAELDEELDLTGFVLLPAAAEPHAHLDKSRTWERISPAFGDLPAAVAQYEAYADAETRESIAARARATAMDMLAHGITAVRSHVNILGGADPLRGVDALLEVRDELRGLMDIELCTLADDSASEALHAEAVARGVDLIGGAPHLAADPDAELDRLLGLAEALGCSVDMHTDESLEGPLTIRALAQRAATWPTATASAGHCSRLGTLPEPQLSAVLDEVVRADLGIITLPMTNLYLQGWGQPVATPRGITAVRRLLDAGARLGAGADNVRDPFNPLGRCDPWETVMLLVTAAHVTIDEAVDLVTSGARAVMRLTPAGPAPGSRADLMAIKGKSLNEVAATADPNRFVIHRGRLVSATTATVVTATPTIERKVSA